MAGEHQTHEGSRAVHPLYLKRVQILTPALGLLSETEFSAGTSGTVVDEGSGEVWTDVDVGDNLVTVLSEISNNWSADTWQMNSSKLTERLLPLITRATK